MSIIWFEGFRNQAFEDDLDANYTISTPASVSESALTDRWPDCYGLFLDSETIERTIDIGSARSVVVGFALNDVYTALGTVCALRSGAGTQVSLCIDADGLLHVYRGDHTGVLLASASGGTELADNQTYYIECKFVSDDASGTATVYVDGTSVISATGLDTESSPADIDGVLLGGNSDAIIADWYILDATDGVYPTDVLGPGVRCQVHMPLASTVYQDFRANTGTIVDAVDGVPDGDTTYVGGRGTGLKNMYIPEALSGLRDSLVAVRMSAVVRTTIGGGTVRFPLAQAGGYAIRPTDVSEETVTTNYARINHTPITEANSTSGIAPLFDDPGEWAGLSIGFGSVTGNGPWRFTQFCAQTIGLGGTVGEARTTQLAVQVLSSGAADQSRVNHLAVQVLSSGGATADPEELSAQEVRIGTPLQWVAEITYSADESGTLATILATDGEPWATASTDTPASTYVQPRLIQPAHIERVIFNSTATFGAVATSYGVCEIANSDGVFDDLAAGTFAGHPFVLRAGRIGDEYPGAWTTILSATMQAVECELDVVRFRLRDRIEAFDRARLRDPSLPDPQVYGNVLSIEPVLIDEAQLIYAVGRPPTDKLVVIQSLRDNGLPMTHASGATGNYATTIATELAVSSENVPAGTFNWHAGSGRMKLGIKPTGKLTATLRVIDNDDEWEPDPDYNPNVQAGTILSQMAQSAGIDVADIDVGDVLRVDVASGTVPYGYWDSGIASTLQAMESVSNSIGVYFGFDRLDRLRMAQFAQPVGGQVWTFTQHNIVARSLRRITPSDVTRGVPVWRVIARSGHVASPTEVWAGAVEEADKAALGPEWPMQTAAEDSSVLDFAPTATELVIDCYTGGVGRDGGEPAQAAGDNGEAARRLGLYDEVTQMVQLEAPATALLLSTVDIGSTVELQYPRYGWDDGVLFLVVGMRPDIARREVMLTLWRNGTNAAPPPE